MTSMHLLRRGRMVGLVGASALVLSGCNFTPYSLPLPGGADVGDHPYTVKAEFRDALDIVPQGGVRSSDVTVGRITDVKLKPGSWTALVTMEVNGDTRLPDNTEATIRQTSLLGEKFVSLDAPAQGSYGRLGDGDVIGLEHSGRNPELEEVLSAAALLFNGGGLDKINTITRELNKVLDGRESDVRELITNSTEFTQTLDRNKNAIIGALERINRLARATNAQEDEIDVALRDIPPALEVLDDQREDLVKLLESLDDLGDVATDVIRKSKKDTITDLRLLQPVVQGLADAGDSLAGVLRQLPTFPFSDAIVGDSLARAEAACPADTVAVARAGACFGDYINLDVNLTLNPEQAQTLLLGILSMGGFQPPAALAASTPAAATTATPKPSAAATATAGPNGVDGATGGTKGLLPGATQSAPAEPQEKKSGGLLGFLGLNRTPAVSLVEAQQTDVGRLLVGPVVAE
ncbi:MAG TPA: MCE family protein [Aeromicrobium sp.]|nr:MCE family protein [Aeromicrobium sp.]